MVMKRKTLHQIAGAEERVCQCCGRLLRLQTWHVVVPKGSPLPPAPPDDEIGILPRVEIKRGRSSLHPENNEQIEYWDGHYRGYDNRWCSLICTRRFANASYASGMRIKGIKGIKS
jgi:hypothetical protein